MPATLPSIDFDALSEADLRQLYWRLFQMLKEDFMHKEDVKNMLTMATVNGGYLIGTTAAPSAPLTGTVASATIAFVPTEEVGMAKAAEYKTKETTGAAVREGIVEGAKETIG